MSCGIWEFEVERIKWQGFVLIGKKAVLRKKFVLTEIGFWGILWTMILLRARTQSIKLKIRKRNGLFWCSFWNCHQFENSLRGLKSIKDIPQHNLSGNKEGCFIFPPGDRTDYSRRLKWSSMRRIFCFLY